MSDGEGFTRSSRKHGKRGAATTPTSSRLKKQTSSGSPDRLTLGEAFVQGHELVRHGATLQEFYDHCESLLIRLGWLFGKERGLIIQSAKIAANYFGGVRRKAGRLTWIINSLKVFLKELKYATTSPIINLVAVEMYFKTKDTHDTTRLDQDHSG